MLGSGSYYHVTRIKSKGKEHSRNRARNRLFKNTVRKSLRAEGILARKPHPKRGSKLDPYKNTIQELINIGIFNYEVIYERIKEEGCTGGRTIILRDYVRQFSPPEQVPAACRYETKAGQQAQVTGANTPTLTRKPVKYVSFTSSSRCLATPEPYTRNSQTAATSIPSSAA